MKTSTKRYWILGVSMINSDDRSLIQHLMGEDVLAGNSSAVEFLYILNPDGTIRWIYPKQFKKPYFLSFYSTSSFRAKVLSSIIKLAFFTKQSHRVKSGDLKLNISKGSRLGKVLNEYSYTGFSIFTGTAGENRKAVIELHNDKQPFMFVKIALTDAARMLVSNEAKYLEYLNTFEFSSMVVPKLLNNNEQDTIGLSNIKPQSFKQNHSLSDLHVKALSELYSKSTMQIKWTDLNVLYESRNKAKMLLDDYEVVNDLKKSIVQGLVNKILLLMNMLEEKDDEVTVAISHGDFAPWNMYSSNNILYLFDWELSQNNMPLFFDLFHFVFQSGVMIKHAKYTEIFNELNNLMKMQNMQSLIDNYNVDFNKNYMFYLAYNVTYYLNKYIKQKDLHQQSFWLIDVWEKAINDLLQNKGIILK